MIASDRLFEPFNDGKTCSRTATPSAGIRCRRRSRWPTWTSSNARASTTTSRSWHRRSAPRWKLYDLPIVGDVRGEGFFYGIELVKDKATKETFNDEEAERMLRGFLPPPVRGRPVLPRRRPRRPRLQLAPPLISGQEFDAI